VVGVGICLGFGGCRRSLCRQSEFQLGICLRLGLGLGLSLLLGLGDPVDVVSSVWGSVWGFGCRYLDVFADLDGTHFDGNIDWDGGERF
jgi:hypothetical protein